MPPPAQALPRLGSILVVGAGLAGLRVAAELRARGFAGTLTVAGAEPLPPYDRPPLSKHLFDRAEPAWLADDGLGDLAALADDVLLGHRATALRAEAEAAEVDLAGPAGERTLRADAVVLALGAHAVAPPTWQGALTLHTAEDAARLREASHAGARLIVVGAGWIGAEVAGQAAAHGCEVTVLEAAPAPLARQAGTAVGGRTVPWYAAAGVELRCTTPVREIRPGEVVLDDETLGADVVLAAIGVRPATGWLAGTLPLTLAGAIPVDAAGRVTGGPSRIRAVGDCAEMTTAELGPVPGGHWDAALTHPAALAAGLLGQDLPPLPAPYVFSAQLGHDIAVVGTPREDARLIDRGDDEAWTALYVTGPAAAPRLLAGLAADRPRDVGHLRRLLAAGAAPVLDPEAAADPAVPLRKAVLA